MNNNEDVYPYRSSSSADESEGRSVLDYIQFDYYLKLIQQIPWNFWPHNNIIRNL